MHHILFITKLQDTFSHTTGILSSDKGKKHQFINTCPIVKNTKQIVHIGTIYIYIYTHNIKAWNLLVTSIMTKLKFYLVVLNLIKTQYFPVIHFPVTLQKVPGKDI